MRRRVVTGVATNSRISTGLNSDLNETMIGISEMTPNGYQIRLSRVFFLPGPKGGGQRIRIALFQKDNFVRHIDLTVDLALSLRDLLSKMKEAM